MTIENVAVMLCEMLGAIVLVPSLLPNWGTVVSPFVKRILHASGSTLMNPGAF